jgi:hypothetical protein
MAEMTLKTESDPQRNRLEIVVWFGADETDADQFLARNGAFGARRIAKCDGTIRAPPARSTRP